MRAKWRAFIDAYFLHHMNATDAYCEVYGADKFSGAASAARLLKNVKVAEAIKLRLDENKMSADEVVHGLADIARGDMADLMDITTSGFTLQLLVDGPDGQKIINPKTKLIKKIKQKVTTILAKGESGEDREIIETDVELYSAHEAYRDLGKVHGLFIDRSEITVTEPVKFVEVEIPPEDKDDASDEPTD